MTLSHLLLSCCLSLKSIRVLPFVKPAMGSHCMKGSQSATLDCLGVAQGFPITSTRNYPKTNLGLDCHYGQKRRIAPEVIHEATVRRWLEPYGPLTTRFPSAGPPPAGKLRRPPESRPSGVCQSSCTARAPPPCSDPPLSIRGS